MSQDHRIDREGRLFQPMEDGIRRALRYYRTEKDGVYTNVIADRPPDDSLSRQAETLYGRVKDRINSGDLDHLIEHHGVSSECGEPCGEDGCVCLRRGFARAFEDRVSTEGSDTDS